MHRHALLLTLLALLLAAAPAPAAASGGTRSVAVRDDLFSPRTVTISAGDKVTWSWRGRG